MKRVMLVVSIIALAALCAPAAWAASAGSSQGGRTITAADPAPQATWTIALYVDADNNLASCWRRYDLPELKRLAPDSRVNVVAIVDLPGRTGVKLLQLGNGEAKVLARYNERDLGRQRSLTWFLRKVATLFPSDHLMVDMWDHGGAWSGLCWDESSNDHLTMAELRGSLLESGVPIDVLSCDTCLTADMAVAYDVSLTGAVDYLVASEESVPGDGFAYDAMLRPLLADPDEGVEQLLGDMVDGYERYYRGIDFESTTNLSAIDVDRVGAMRADLQRWSAALEAALPADGTRIASDMRRSPWAEWSYQVDVGALAGRLADDEWLSSDELREASAAVATDEAAAVVAEAGSKTAGKLTGMTVWLGTGGEWRVEHRAFLQETAFASQTGWFRMLKALNAVTPRLSVYSGDGEDQLSLNDVAFTDALHGYAAGSYSFYGWSIAVVLRTDDGGVSWDETAWSPWGGTFTGLAALGDGRFATVSSSGSERADLLKFGGGKRHAWFAVPSSSYFYDVASAGAGAMWVSGSDGALLATSDGGRSWRRLTAAPFGRLTSVELADAEHGWVACEDLMGDASTISVTSDGGASFTTQATVPGVALCDLQAVDAQQLWSCGGDRLGGDGVILHSGDGGATWAVQLSGADVPLLADVSMVDAQTGWAVGDGGAVYKTTDAGLDWQQVDVPTTADLTGVTFGDARHGCIVGDGDEVLVTSDGGLTWREPTVDVTSPVAPKWSPVTHAAD